MGATADGTESGEPASDPVPRRSAIARALQSLVLAAPVVALAAAGFAHRSMSEDGFIYLRVVRQIREGHGPVFNAGERVEAFTGTLWVGILSVADLVTPIRLEWLAVLIGLFLACTGVALAIAGACRLWDLRGDGPWLVPLGAVVFVAVSPAWGFATSGLETGLSFAWLGACLWVLGGWARGRGGGVDRRLSIPRAVLLGLGWLIRPDLVLFSAGFLLLVAVSERTTSTKRATARTAAAMVALPLAYQVFRMGYYGSLVPNTAIAKEGSSTNWSRGWLYVTDFAGPYWLWLAGIALVAGGYVPLGAAAARAGAGRRAPLVAGVFVAAALLHVVYIAAVGGDYIHARLLLPAFFALCIPVAVVPVTARHVAAAIIAPWAIAAVVSFRPVQAGSNPFAHGFVEARGYGSVTTDDHFKGAGPDVRALGGNDLIFQGAIGQFQALDRPLATDLHPPVAGMYGIGVLAYAVGTRYHVVDLMGLADSFTAHLETRRSPTGGLLTAGHEKPLPPTWTAARLTRHDTVVRADEIPFLMSATFPPPTGAAFEEGVAWARAALRCPDLVRLQAAASASMSPRRFGTNLLRAFANTRMRIPPDPRAAYHRFCGPGTPPEVARARR